MFLKFKNIKNYKSILQRLCAIIRNIIASHCCYAFLPEGLLPEASSCHNRHDSHHWDIDGDQRINEWASQMGLSMTSPGSLVAISTWWNLPFLAEIQTLIITSTLLAAQLADQKLPRVSWLFSSASYSLSCRSHIHHLSFLYSSVYLPSTGHISRALRSKLIRHGGTKQRENRFFITWPDWVCLSNCTGTEKSLTFKNWGKDLCLLPKKRDEQGRHAGCLPPLPRDQGNHSSRYSWGSPGVQLSQNHCL